MTKNPNPGLFISFFFVFVRWGGGGLGGTRGSVGEGVGAIIFICDALYQHITYCLTFS